MYDSRQGTQATLGQALQEIQFVILILMSGK